VTLILSPVGLVLGIVALVRLARRAREGRPLRGKGLAVAAVSVSGAVALVAVLILTGVVRVWTFSSGVQRDNDGSVGQKTSATVIDLRKGDCFTPQSGLPDGTNRNPGVLKVDIVPCDQPHQGEAYGVATVHGPDRYPGKAAVTRLSREACVDPLFSYVADLYAMPPVRTYFYQPDQAGWTAGRRGVVCWIGDPSGTLRESVRQSATDLDPDQRAFVEALHPLNAASLYMPVEEPTDGNLTEYTAWARLNVGAVRDTVSNLKRIDPPAGDRSAADAVVRQLQVTGLSWDKAARAKDVATLRAALTEVRDRSAVDQVAQARKLLGLPA
jgi:hypothetical protein